MDAAVLPAGVQDAVGGGPEAAAVIRDHQMDALEAAAAERAVEVEPEVWAGAFKRAGQC